MWAVLIQSISIKAGQKANIFFSPLLWDFAIDEKRKTSSSCLSCKTNIDGNGTPKQIVVGKQHDRSQAEMRFDMTVQACFLSSIFSVVPQCHRTFSNSLLVCLDYYWLCSSVTLPQPNTATRFDMDVCTKPATRAVRQIYYIKVTHELYHLVFKEVPNKQFIHKWKKKENQKHLIFSGDSTVRLSLCCFPWVDA